MVAALPRLIPSGLPDDLFSVHTMRDEALNCATSAAGALCSDKNSLYMF